MSLKDEITAPIPCPKCGKKTKKSLAWLERNKTFSCSCGATIAIQGKGSAAANRSLDGLEKALNKLGAKRKR